MKHILTYRPKSPGTNNGGYRYFFNGQEGDNEVFGEVANFGYEFRQYDSRLGRWWSVDPKWSEYPGVSPFVFCNGSPILMMEPDGRFGIPIHRDILEKAMFHSGTSSHTHFLFHHDLLWGATRGADGILTGGAFMDWHFDNRANYSDIQDRWNSLNKEIVNTISKISIVNKLFGGGNVVKLGKLLHNVQDFYAHSNYAELYIEYYQGANNGELPTSLPTYDEGVKNADFNKLLKENLRTGDFHLLDNEIIDLNPFQEHANEPTSHNKMNKDNADTYAGKLAKQAAIDHTSEILKTLE